MRSTITARGQTVVPAAIRRHFNLSPADRLEWIIENNTIRIIPVVAADPIAAFRGQGKGGSVERLFELITSREQILPYKNNLCPWHNPKIKRTQLLRVSRSRTTTIEATYNVKIVHACRAGSAIINC